MARRTLAANTPAKLRVLGASLVLLSLAWGALGAWTVSEHACAASDVVHVEEPLALAAQRMYEAVSDADVTATTTFLSGPRPPLASLQHYRADVAQAAADLTKLKSAAGGNTALTAALSGFSAGLPVYTGYVAQAQTEYALGYPLTGGSFMQVASEQAHLVLLPAAKTSYSLQGDALAAASDQATTLPPLIVAALLAVITGITLLRAQRWLARRTHRILNAGLVAASAALIVSVAWLAITFSVARSDLDTGIGSGSRPAATRRTDRCPAEPDGEHVVLADGEMLEQPANGQRGSADPDLQSGRVQIIGLEPERRAQPVEGPGQMRGLGARHGRVPRVVGVSHAATVRPIKDVLRPECGVRQKRLRPQARTYG